ncbi:MAG: hypothetical protein ACKO2G_09850 [Verrucomicrobiales bacterium]
MTEGPIFPMNNFDHIWTTVIKECGVENRHLGFHGIDHWRRVERNGLILSHEPGVDLEVVRLFAVFHDCQRLNDGWDPQHGARGAEFASSLRGRLFELEDHRFALLEHACIWHTQGGRNDDPTIGACWDADRLDLGRVGIIPSAEFMSTDLAADIADHGSIDPWLPLAEAFGETESKADEGA